MPLTKPSFARDLRGAQAALLASRGWAIDKWGVWKSPASIGGAQAQTPILEEAVAAQAVADSKAIADLSARLAKLESDLGANIAACPAAPAAAHAAHAAATVAPASAVRSAGQGQSTRTRT